MEFRILGPLEVADGDNVIPLASANQRGLLAILLLSVNEVVSADRLIDALWREQGPESARTALRRLRLAPVRARRCRRNRTGGLRGRGGLRLV